MGMRDRLAGRVRITHPGRGSGVIHLKVGTRRPFGHVLESICGQVTAISEPAPPVHDVRELRTHMAKQRPVVDRSRVRPAGPDQLLGGVRIAEADGGAAHEVIQAAEQEVQIGLLARPQPTVQQPVDPVVDPARTSRSTMESPISDSFIPRYATATGTSRRGSARPGVAEAGDQAAGELGETARAEVADPAVVGCACAVPNWPGGTPKALQ